LSQLVIGAFFQIGPVINQKVAIGRENSVKFPVKVHILSSRKEWDLVKIVQKLA
jgi:hypothetical protein